MNSDHRLDLWREADRRVGLFDAETGPRKLAVWVMSGPETVQQALTATGLDDPVREAVADMLRYNYQFRPLRNLLCAADLLSRH